MAQPVTRLTRRRVLAGLAAPALLYGCDRFGSAPSFRDLVLRSGERMSYHVHRLIGSNALAPEYAASDLSPDFRTNGNTQPADPDYRRHQTEGFAGWQLAIDGLVGRPQRYGLDDLRAMPSRTQITRHDCVEGWSAIGQWTGVTLSTILDDAQLLPDARYIVFHCADSFGSTRYYESIDLIDAFHPQTILAYGMNGAPLAVGHGAPLRLRVERQLGYKQAKFIMRVEAVATLGGIAGGQGGFWEDVGFYDWYAGV